MSVLKLLFFGSCSKIKSPKPVMLRHLFQGCSTRSVNKILNHLGAFHRFFPFFFLGKKNRIYTLASARANVLCAGAMTTALEHLMHIFCLFFFLFFLQSCYWKGSNPRFERVFFLFLEQSVLQELWNKLCLLYINICPGKICRFPLALTALGVPVDAVWGFHWFQWWSGKTCVVPMQWEMVRDPTH